MAQWRRLSGQGSRRAGDVTVPYCLSQSHANGAQQNAQAGHTACEVSMRGG